MQTVDFSDNKIVFANLNSPLIFLEKFNLSNNKLREIKLPFFESLQFLNLSRNCLSSIEISGLPKLKCVEIRENQLKSLSFLCNCPCLTEVYASENQIEVLEGLEGCPNLVKLHLRKNVICSIKLNTKFNKLKYLNFRENNLSHLNDLIDCISKTCFPVLESLNLIGNPVLAEKNIDPISLILDKKKINRINKESTVPEI